MLLQEMKTGVVALMFWDGVGLSVALCVHSDVSDGYKGGGGGALEGGVTTFDSFIKHLNKASTRCEERQFLDQSYY